MLTEADLSKYTEEDLVKFTKEELHAIVCAHEDTTCMKRMMDDNQMYGLVTFAFDYHFYEIAKNYLNNLESK